MLNNGEKIQANGRIYTVLELLGRGANTVAYLAECHHGELISKCILKEFAPRNPENIERGKARFLESGRMQNRIRQLSVLGNQTPPVSHIFEVDGTAFIAVACYNGTTMDKLHLPLPASMELCRTIAKTISYYHQNGFLCLDLKPENIFVLQNAPDDLITQLVEFIDFDSIRNTADIHENTVFSYTREWAAPEQRNPYTAANVSETADIFTLGEIIFYLLFGRHSTEQEHRGFSKYPFASCIPEYRKYTDRPDIAALFTQIFRGTIRSSATNRFTELRPLIELLERLITELNRNEYIIPKLPPVPPYFVGRDAELKAVSSHLQTNHILYVTGLAGIGKSTLIRKFIEQRKPEYDVIAYLEYDGDFLRTFCDDMQLQISTMHRQDGEDANDYYTRKLTAFQRICGEKRVLFVIDNFSGMISKDMSRIFECGFDTVIVTRNQPPKNSFPHIEIDRIAESADIFKLLTLNLERQLTKDERICFTEIITLVQGHTLVLELIARQIAAGKLDIHTALQLIRENGFSRFSDEKVGNYKDGEEVYDTLSAIISALFDASGMTMEEHTVMKVLALMNVRGLETTLLRDIVKLDLSVISGLSVQGWLYSDARTRLHPVVAETVRNWEWTNIPDIEAMAHHKKVIDIYVGMANDAQIMTVIQEAERYKTAHPRHIVNAMYYDMYGCYYDTLLAGNYIPYNAKEAQLLEKMIDFANRAIEEITLSSDSHKTDYQIQYLLSMAAILIRSTPNYSGKAAKILKSAKELIEQYEPEISRNRCYLNMVCAWYYTLVKPDISKTKSHLEHGENIAESSFSTELERIDIVYIPAANCLYYHGDMNGSAKKLEDAIAICKQYPDMLSYIDKRADLMTCLLDVYLQMKDMHKCRALIAEIDRINETYREQGIFREIPPEKRAQAGS